MILVQHVGEFDVFISGEDGGIRNSWLRWPVARTTKIYQDISVPRRNVEILDIPAKFYQIIKREMMGIGLYKDER